MAKPDALKRVDDQKERETLKYIGDALSMLRKRNAKYEYLHHLASEVAEIVSDKRGERISYTTLTRNKVYKRKLLSYMGIAEKNKELSITEKKELEEQIFDAKLAIGNLQAENERIRNYIANISDSDVKLLGADSEDDSAHYRNVATNLAMIIDAIKEHFGEEMVWDEKRNTILEAGLEDVIIDGEPVRVFNEWMLDAKRIRGER